MAVPITLRKLTKHFNTTVAVDGIDLDIPAGSLFFLLGPSGCGKTTLLRMLAGFTDPTHGSIHFGDRDVTRLPPDQRHTGMCFQSYALWPHMTVFENIAFGLKVRKQGTSEISQRVQQALDMVQMSDYARRKPNELSGGQQQRIALARALVIEPELLLLDEPLSNLDAKLRLEMRAQIRSLCKQAGITTVYVTHDQKEALSMADHMAVLRDGKLIQQGTPFQLYQQPATRFVADFLGESNFYPATVREQSGDMLTLDTPLGVLVSRTFPPDAQTAKALTCSIRPEAVCMLDDGDQTFADSTNVLTASHIESMYLGEMAQHQFRISDGHLMKVFELNPRPQLQKKSSRNLRVDPRDVVVLID